MTKEEAKYFDLLKNEVVKTFRKVYPGASVLMQEWKGETIVMLQDELLEKVNEHISEKWFYNHIKSRGKHLPRIDMLNLLCKYCGYADWQDFTYRNRKEILVDIPSGKSNSLFIILPLLVIILASAMYLLYKNLINIEYTFCCVSYDDSLPITSYPVYLELLSDSESPRIFQSDSSGCIRLKTSQRRVKIVISSQYYRADTLIRSLKKFDPDEIIKLRTDDYALMLKYFSVSDVNAWKSRRMELDRMIFDEAIIYEVFRKEIIGQEMYNKWEFINKMTLPAKSLDQIEILNVEYANDKIIRLRFTQYKHE